MPPASPRARRAAARPCIGLLLIALLLPLLAAAQTPAAGRPLTYAERLGWPAGTRALILHVDDAGMSLDSNRGTIRAIEDGLATSLSVIMPTPWVPQMVQWIRKRPEHDAGLHLTLTSEWGNYRWEPLSGRGASGLIDPEGAFWPTRLGDLEAMLDPRLAAVIEAEGIVLTTWRELMRRRQAVGDGRRARGR